MTTLISSPLKPVRDTSTPRVAVVHDWLYVYGGAERVLRSILRCYPDADVFTLFDFLTPADRARIGFTTSTTSFLQRIPGMRRRHRSFLPMMPLAIEQLDLSGYDIVISSSYAVAKGVLTGPDQLHLSYVHSPMRYAWDLQEQYLAEAGLSRGLKGAIARLLLHRLRIWDARTANGVNSYMVNSHFVGRRVRKAYGRTSEVIHPPVDVPERLVARTRGGSFLTASRLVGYKNTRAIIEAFRDLPDQHLFVVGTGPEYKRLAGLAGPNVTMLGFVPDAALRQLMGEARAFIFAAEEDFGIVPVEAQAEGTPVLALGRGGALETIVTSGPWPTGMFFEEPTPAAISTVVRRFLARTEGFSAAACHANALQFSEARFREQFSAFVRDQHAAFTASVEAGRARSPQPPRLGVAIG